MCELNSHSMGVERVYELYADMLFRLSYSILMSKEDAEDAVLDVFSKFLSSKPVFNDPEHMKAWLLRVTVNRSRDIARRRRVRSYTPLHEMTFLPGDAKSKTGVLDEVMALPEKYRTAIIIHYFEGFSVEETAAILRITKSGVKMRLSRGREMLKTALENGENEYV